MPKILKMSDRINLAIGGVTFTLAPLNYLQKQELAGCTKMIGGEEHYDLVKAQALYIKYSLKKVAGIEGFDGKEYELEFNGDYLTDDCVSEILNLEIKDKLTTAAWQLLNGVRDLKNPIDGEPLEGVEMEIVGQGK